MNLSAVSIALPLLAAAVAAALTFGVIALLLRRYQRETLEANAGLKLLHDYKWSELAQLLVQALRLRGYDSADSERIATSGGFDLMVQRGSERYLLQCKHGGAIHVDGAAVRNLHALVPTYGASGAIMVTTGRFDASAQEAAKRHRVQLLDGLPLWFTVKGVLPAQTLDQIERAITAKERSFTMMKLGSALLAGVVVYFVSTLWLPRPAPVAAVRSAPAPAATAASPPAVAAPTAKAPATSAPATTAPAPTSQASAPAVSTPGATAPAATAPPALAQTAPPPASPAPAKSPAKVSIPVPELTEAQEQERRAAAVAAVRAVAGVASAEWSSKSTLAVALLAGNEQRRESLVATVCNAVVANEELRYTRLQVTDSLAESEADKRVHWRQCQ